MNTEYTEMNAAIVVGEIFSAAGVAFCQLGELTTMLHPSAETPHNGKWSPMTIEMFQRAVKKFHSELTQVTDSLKRQKPMDSEKGEETDLQVKRFKEDAMHKEDEIASQFLEQQNTEFSEVNPPDPFDEEGQSDGQEQETVEEETIEEEVIETNEINYEQGISLNTYGENSTVFDGIV